MGRKFVHSPLTVHHSEIDPRARPQKRYTFCQQYRTESVPRYIQNENDEQGKLDVIRQYLLGISDYGVKIRRRICKPTCKRPCSKLSGMSVSVNTLDVFLKLNDYESALWNCCLYKIANNISTHYIDDVLERFERDTDEYTFDSDTESEIEYTYSRDWYIPMDDHDSVQDIDECHFIQSWRSLIDEM